MGYIQVILAEFRSGRIKTGHVKRLLTSHLVRLGNISSLVTLTFPYTPLVEVKQAQNTWSYRQISKFSTTWKYSQSGHTNISIHTSCRSETSSKCLVVLDKYQNLVPLGNIPSRVTLTFPYTPLVEVKQAQNAWSF